MNLVDAFQLVTCRFAFVSRLTVQSLVLRAMSGHSKKGRAVTDSAFEEYVHAHQPARILHETSSRERWKCGRFGPEGRS